MDSEEHSAQNSETASGRTPGELASMATHQMSDTLARGQVKLSELQAALAEQTRVCARQTDVYVRENPWKAVGWALGAGFILGVLARRR